MDKRRKKRGKRAIFLRDNKSKAKGLFDRKNKRHRIDTNQK